MSTALLRKLETIAPLTAAEREVVKGLGEAEPVVPAGADIVAAGQVPRRVFVLESGMACRYKILDDGRRQILTFLLPGDLCDLHVFLATEMDHSIGTLSECRISGIETRTIIRCMSHYDRIGAGLWWAAMQEEAILRERLVIMGRLPLGRRIGWLICEHATRLRAVEEGGSEVVLPLTRDELADCLGVTVRHLARSLCELEDEGLLARQRQGILVRDVDALAETIGFDGRYLHLDGAPQETWDLFESLEQKSDAS